MNSKMFDVEKIIATVKEIGMEVELNLDNHGFYFTLENGEIQIISYDDVVLGLNLLDKLNKLKEDDKSLEFFGTITLQEQSYFRFVKYKEQEKVHVCANYKNDKIEEFESFNVMEKKLMKWILDIFELKECCTCKRLYSRTCIGYEDNLCEECYWEEQEILEGMEGEEE
ncbi:hypothetical protein [Bacillus cereus group sp. BfR-BA-02730]|uniref:hypothetical protein n=1 Tax=Bacillus cereus group sp. BfR-BA-02730 TaxID=3094893 RepID=UPI0029C2CA69|nr:hypothetical protein [Bacillus cereus group sp. BfR-BA-02730]MDX5808725.1 hypothetical protein [Bacillus cereus group sp. BfR-BA-02730]